VNCSVRKYVPGEKLDAELPAGKLPKIWVLDELTVVNFIEPSVMIALLPKFCPFMVSVLCRESTVVLITTGTPAARAGPLTAVMKNAAARIARNGTNRVRIDMSSP
jgi:hypothetical protein